MERGTKTPNQPIVVSRYHQYKIMLSVFGTFLVAFWLFSGGNGNLFNFGVSASAVHSSGLKFQSMFEPNTPDWHMALSDNDDARDFTTKLASAPMLPARTYYGDEAILSYNSSTMSIRNGLLYSLDEHGPGSELVTEVNKHLSLTPGLDLDISAPQLLVAITGAIVVAGLACIFIPGCAALFATNLGNAIHIFHVATGGVVTGDAGGVAVGLATAAASIGARSEEVLDLSVPGMIGYEGYYVSLDLHSHVSRTLEKRDQFEDENFACIYNNGWAGVCHNRNLLMPMVQSVLSHDNSAKDAATCWQVNGNDGPRGWYYHCIKPNAECNLPCNHGAPLPPFPCANLNDKGGKPWHEESDRC